MRRNLSKFASAILVLAAAFSLALAAHADTFNFTFTDAGGVSGSGTLTGVFEGVGNPWLITGCNGCTFNDGDDSGSVSLVANPNGPGGSTRLGSGPNAFDYDDLLDLFRISGTYLDEDGLAFQFGNGDDLNIFFGYSVGGGGPVYDGWYDYPQGNGDVGFLSETGTFAITSYDIPISETTPEPGTFVSMCTGILGLAALLFWKGKRLGLALNR